MFASSVTYLVEALADLHIHTVHLVQKPFICPSRQLHLRGTVREAICHVCTVSRAHGDSGITYKHPGNTSEWRIALSVCIDRYQEARIHPRAREGFLPAPF